MVNHYPTPTSPPVYESRPVEVKKNPKRIYALLDSAFAGIGLALTFWFAALLLFSGLSLGWYSIPILVAFFLVLTYLALPRMHQIFTTLYLPDYFMARTKTGDGLLGDPVNLGVLGSEEDIHAAMQRAKWVRADDITLRTSLSIVRSSITGRSYPAAPVSDLFLFGNKQDFAYQQEVDGSAAQRHHVRFWRVPEGWQLPGGERVEWLAAGTYDKSVGLSTMTLQITHKIDANIDAERDYIINSVRYVDPGCSVRVIEQFSSAFLDRNGGGDTVQTDGDMPVLDFSGAAERLGAAAEPVAAEKSVTEDLLNRELPPKPFTFVGIFLLVQVVLALLALTGSLLPHESQGAANRAEDIMVAVVSLIITVFLGILFLLAVKRSKWARLGFLMVVSLAAAGQLLLLSSGESSGLVELANAGILVLLVLSFSAPSVREWVFSLRRRGGNRPVGQ